MSVPSARVAELYGASSPSVELLCFWSTSSDLGMRCAYPSPLGFQSLATEIATPPSDHIPLPTVLFVVPVVAAPTSSAARRFAGANADLSTGDRRPIADGRRQGCAQADGSCLHQRRPGLLDTPTSSLFAAIRDYPQLIVRVHRGD